MLLNVYQRIDLFLVEGCLGNWLLCVIFGTIEIYSHFLSIVIGTHLSVPTTTTTTPPLPTLAFAFRLPPLLFRESKVLSILFWEMDRNVMCPLLKRE